MVNAFIPRLAGLLAAWLAAEAAKHGLTLDPEELTLLIVAVYAAVHRLASRYLNPGDATRSALIHEDKAVVAEALVAKRGSTAETRAVPGPLYVDPRSADKFRPRDGE